MSTAFLKKSLELVDTEAEVLREDRGDGEYSKLKFRSKKKKLKDLRGAGDVKRKNIEAVEKIRRESKELKNDLNLKRKLKLLHSPVNNTILTKILEHIQAPGLDLEKQNKKEEKTVFTEEDFKKFEKEYFSN